jgi:hypothetical protein
MGRSTPEQARIRIEFSGIPGVTTNEIAFDVKEDSPDHHGQAVADAFDAAEKALATNKAAATSATPAPAPEAPAKPAKKRATKKSAKKGKK